MKEDEIIRKFRERRRRANLLGWPLVAMGLGSFMLTMLLPKSDVSASILIALAGWAVALVGILIVYYLTRCPACNASPMISTIDGSTGILLDPTECPKCSARLK